MLHKLLFWEQLCAEKGHFLHKLHACQVVVHQAVGNPRAANFSFLQPLRARNQFHHPLDVAGPFGQIRGGFGGIALEGVGKAGGNEGGLSGGEF